MTVNELVTTWGFEIDDKPLKELDEKVKAVKESFKHLIEVVGAEVAAVFGLAETTANAAREATNLAQASGTTAREIQRLEFASKVAGVESDQLHLSLRRLSQSAVNAAEGGSETNMIFSQLGIRVFDASGKVKNSTTLLKEMSAVFKTLPDGPLKTNAAIHLLGRSGSDLIPVLNSNLRELGDEGERLGYVMTEGELASGKQFMVKLHELEAVVQGITRGIGNKLIPVFTELMEQLKGWYEQNKDIIAQNVAQYVFAMAESLKLAWKFSNNLFNAVKTLTGGFSGMKIVLAGVVGLFAGFQTATMIRALTTMLPFVWKTVAALRAVILGETMATGGMSLLLSAGAGIAAMAGTAYLMNASSNESAVNGSFRNAVPVSSTTNNKVASVQNFHSTFQIRSIGTSAQQVQQITQLVDKHMKDTLRSAAVSASPTVR